MKMKQEANGVPILVTGGAGYIGSHICKKLKQQGFYPISYDNLSRGFKSSVLWGPLVEGDLRDAQKLQTTMEKYKIQAVVHLAAYASIEESVRKPLMYFENNLYGSLFLLEAMNASGVKNLVFSSSCAVYGKSVQTPIEESCPREPINPYGLSKKILEDILQDLGKKTGIHFVCLRYFNAAGADKELQIGESHDPETHILPNIIKAGLNKTPLEIFGKDYPTRDGTCVRDFIHVEDLASAHHLALKKLMTGSTNHHFYNLGQGRGFSILEIIEEVQKAMDQKIQLQFRKRRPGDPPELIASSKRFEKEFGWKPKNSNLQTIIQSALAWEIKKTKNPKSFKRINNTTDLHGR